MDISVTSINASRRARQRGFTLVEMLAVIAVMLIVLRLTLPSLDGLLGSDAEGMARTQLIGDLNKARSMALERGGLYTWCSCLCMRISFQ